MNAKLLALVLMGALFAGCTDEPTESQDAKIPVEETTSTTTTSSTGTTAAPAGEPTPADETAPNRAPEVTFVPNATSVDAGSGVTFAINATDADGDELSWTLDGDGDGVVDAEGTEATVSFTYEAAGNFVATLNVTDGNSTVTATATIEVIEVVVDEPTGTEYPVTFSQDILLSCPHCLLGPDAGQTTCLAVLLDDQGLDCAFFELPADAAGRTFVADGLFLPFIEFHADCTGTDLKEWNTDGTGLIPEGAGCAVMYDAIDPVVTAVFTIA